VQTTTIARLPEPSSTHATCAWCRRRFDTIVELIDHVASGHAEQTLTSSQGVAAA
jgi:hypothetical protein